jgi:hypothetical protein
VQPRTKVRVAAVQAPGYYIPVLSAANFPATAMIFLHAQCSKKSLSGIKLRVLFFFFSRLFSASFTGTTFLGFLPSLARWKQRFERKPGDQECKSVSGHGDQRRGSSSNRARTQRSKTRHLPRAAPKPSSLSLDRHFRFLYLLLCGLPLCHPTEYFAALSSSTSFTYCYFLSISPHLSSVCTRKAKAHIHPPGIPPARKPSPPSQNHQRNQPFLSGKFLNCCKFLDIFCHKFNDFLKKKFTKIKKYYQIFYIWFK